MLWWRRQYPSLANPVARPMEPSGVAGTACGEGCSGEGGRSGTVLDGDGEPDNWLERGNPTRSRQVMLSRSKVRAAISVTREGCPDAVSEVGGDRSSGEVPVMGMDAKGLRFRRGSLEAKGSPYSPKGVASGRNAREPRVALSRRVKAARRGCGNACWGSLSESRMRTIRPYGSMRGGRRGGNSASPFYFTGQIGDFSTC